MDKIKYTTVKTTLGNIAIAGTKNGIQYISLLRTGAGISLKSFTQDDNLFKEASKQLVKYFDGRLKTFKLILNPAGTEFFKKVWNEMSKIPYGKTLSYQELAIKIGHPKAQRAVGMAAKRNPIQFVVPCHRVIGKNLKLRGYNGGLDIKEYLLDMETKYL